MFLRERFLCVCVFNSPSSGSVDSICKSAQCHPIVSPPGFAYGSWVIVFTAGAFRQSAGMPSKHPAQFTELTLLSVLSSTVSSLPMTYLGPNTTFNFISEPFDTWQEKIMGYTFCVPSSLQTVTQGHGCVRHSIMLTNSMNNLQENACFSPLSTC